MKKFLKKLPVLALSVVALASLAGCGEQDNGEKKSVKDLTATVTWWNNYQDPVADGVAEEEARKKSTYTEYYFAKDAIAEFNKIYPNITIETTYKGSYSNIQTAVNTGINSGDIPSMATCYGDHVAGYIKAGVANDVGVYFDDPEIGFGKTLDAEGNVVDDPTTAKSDFSAAYLDGEAKQYSDNKHYSMPYSKSGETMSINKTVFDKVGEGKAGVDTDTYVAPVAAATKEAYSIPTSFSELMDIARKMKQDFPEVFQNNVDADDMYTAIPVCWDSAENMYITFSEMLNVEYTKASNNVAESVLFNNDGAKKFVTQLKKWKNEGLFCTQNQLYYSNKAKGYHQYSSTMVTNGKCFVAFSSTAGATYFATDSGFEAKLCETPVIDETIYSGKGVATTAKSKVISQGPSICFFKKANEDEQKAAWIFYKFLTNTQNGGKLAAAKSYFPLRESGYSTDEVKAFTDAADKVTLESSYADKKKAYTGQVLKLNEVYASENRYISTPVFDLSSACRTAVGNIIKTFLTDKDAQTDAEIKTLVDGAFDDAYKAVVTQ